MSVYTDLTREDIEHILAGYSLGELVAFEGIAAGIENSNFFIDTEQGRYVLTIFERMNPDELPYFMHLMHHLAGKGFACPDVMARKGGGFLFDVAGKKGCVVSCLPGRTLDELSEAQLHSSGAALAALHRAGSDFPERRENPTGMGWLCETVACVLAGTREKYGDEAAALLQDELHFQQACVRDDLPRGVIHGDMFVDNILFEGDAVSGVIDFYYAHDAPYAMDIAISLNAQAILLGNDDHARMQAFLGGYQQVRRLEQAEKNTLPGLLRLAALRFWVSRLYDALFPRGGALTQVKDPEEYRQKLLAHR
ncbi:MAG: homoserine kinase [Mariprofundaceae bacterium]|nr:homoserine kinase [Mariprofundaceae bacterium]